MQKEIDTNEISMEISSEELAKMARHKLTYLLSRREHSQKELLHKLEQLEIPANIASEVLVQFCEKGIQSEQRFAESVVNSAFNKGKGPVYIQQKLQANDIEYSIVRTYLLDEKFDWFVLANKVRVKRFGETLPNDWQVLQKQKRFLAQRGFELEQIEGAFFS